MRALLLIMAMLPLFANALAITTGAKLPTIQVNSSGFITVVNDEIQYQAWDSNSLNGKVYLIQAMAGRTSAKEINAPMIEAVKQAKLSSDQYQTVTIVNTSDAVFGTSGFVKSKLKNNAKDFPNAAFIQDDKGQVTKKWKLAKKSNAIILLDKQGNVLFAKDGALNAQEIEEVMSLIKSNI
ncbi:YtfJ family protein [Alginatibacterium sediminis]|uniref:YtfJ family protein n=1 Tax=Alginatibacterium sediminis TaxID=2164068 RepID=A0A420E907_9ALTE|nr:YtfJ family protein [Alginatibacterium sediminis]RKF15867.1 YtfJ family protein [Alginatibacterium sediminis]